MPNCGVHELMYAFFCLHIYLEHIVILENRVVSMLIDIKLLILTVSILYSNTAGFWLVFILILAIHTDLMLQRLKVFCSYHIKISV